MSPKNDCERIAKLVTHCATTIRQVSRTKTADMSRCPFRSVAADLERAALEIERIAADLPPGWETYLSDPR